MYLKHVAVEGFKSFPEWNGLELPAGTCILVGANGTGKSNLSDALTWVLGESDLETLRVRTPDELVFAGSEELLPMKAAQVTVVFDRRPAREKGEALPAGVCKHGHAATHDGTIPTGALAITRRVVADGREEYMVDGREVTEAQVRAALHRVDISSPPVAVVRQGELERLLFLEPDARRRELEKAAGIPELTQQRTELTARSDALNLQFEHLQGEREEAQLRLAELEREAARAERVEALHDRLAALQGALLAATYRPSSDGPQLETVLQALDLPAPRATSTALWRHTLAQLERSRQALTAAGLANPRAGADCEAMRAHLTGLTRRLEDTRAAKAEIEAGMAALDADVAEAFAAVLTRVEKRFHTYYGLLAPGGEAALPLVEAATAGGAPGVDVVARPPGKLLDRVTVLSGGERSLAALSFALALFQESPAPIFVLDEVEPALDDTNIRRLQAVLDLVADERQIVMVSHQQRAKETGDVVFGVERNLHGASQVKFRYEPRTRRLEIFRRPWTDERLRRFPVAPAGAAPGLAAGAPARSSGLLGGGGSPTQAAFLEVRGPGSGPNRYRKRGDGPWEGIWEALGNPDSTDATAAEPAAKTAGTHPKNTDSEDDEYQGTFKPCC